MNGQRNPYISLTRGFLEGHLESQRIRQENADRAVMNQYRQSLMRAHEAQTDLTRKRIEWGPQSGVNINLGSLTPKELFFKNKRLTGLYGKEGEALDEWASIVPEDATIEEIQEFDSFSGKYIEGAKDYLGKTEMAPGHLFGMGRWGDYDYPQENLLPQFRQYLKDSKFHSLSRGGKWAVLNDWQEAVAEMGNEYQFDMDSPEVIEAMEEAKSAPFPKPPSETGAPSPLFKKTSPTEVQAPSEPLFKPTQEQFSPFASPGEAARGALEGEDLSDYPELEALASRKGIKSAQDLIQEGKTPPDTIWINDFASAFAIDESTNEPEIIMEDGKEIGLRLKNGGIIKIGQTVATNGKRFVYQGGNSWWSD